MMGHQTIRYSIIRPSELGNAERTVWRRLQSANASLHRAFYSPEFATACEQAGYRTFVTIGYDRDQIQCFLPFQFRSRWHERIGLAERAGGHLSDAFGLIAARGFSTSPNRLLRLSRLGALYTSCLLDGQDEFGFDPYMWEAAYQTDLSAGVDAYFEGLQKRQPSFVSKTKQSLRRAAKDYGSLELVRVRNPSQDLVGKLIAEKRAQYGRTNASDALGNSAAQALLEILSSSSARECYVDFCILKGGDTTLGRHLGLRYKDYMNYWFPTYNVEARTVSPGRLLLWEILKSCNSSGVSNVDFGEGDAAYKKYFATGTIRVGKGAWFAGDLRSLVARTMQSVEWRARAVQARCARHSVSIGD